jgi:hypothetical protein
MMRQFLVATVLALAIATPAFAADGNLGGYADYRQNLAKANEYRPSGQAQDQAATQRAAIGNSVTATDAAVGAPATQQHGATPTYAGGYGVGLRALGGCPGTDAAGGPWHPGEYCMPGGR